MAKKTEETPTLSLSIYGLVFDVTAPYAEGHVLNAAEAKTLNQVRKENIGNNVRKRIADLKGEAETFTEEQAAEAASIVAEVDTNYEFTLSSARGTTSRDPLDVMCTKLAREWIAQQLREKGTTVKAYKEDKGEDTYNEKVAEVAEHPQIVALAKERVAAQKAEADAMAKISLG